MSVKAALNNYTVEKCVGKLSHTTTPRVEPLVINYLSAGYHTLHDLTNKRAWCHTSVTVLNSNNITNRTLTDAITFTASNTKDEHTDEVEGPHVILHSKEHTIVRTNVTATKCLLPAWNKGCQTQCIIDVTDSILGIALSIDRGMSRFNNSANIFKGWQTVT